VATVEECQAALEQLSARLAGVDPQTRRKHTLERTVSCQVTDLGVIWRARLGDEGLAKLVQVHDGSVEAQVRLRVSSDDLVALTSGELGFGGALASGRVRVDASVLDLLRLRALL